jgi:hypothetical protein
MKAMKARRQPRGFVTVSVALPAHVADYLAEVASDEGTHDVSGPLAEIVEWAMAHDSAPVPLPLAPGVH